MATNKIYRTAESAITFKDSGGSAVITLQNLAAGAGRVSARYDRGSGSKPVRYRWRAVIQFDSAPAVGEQIEIYLFESDGTYVDGTIGTSDAALTTDKRKNGHLIGCVIVDTTSHSTNIVASGIVEIYDQYFSVGVWNGSAADALKNTANTSSVELQAMPDDIMAAA